MLIFKLLVYLTPVLEHAIFVGAQLLQPHLHRTSRGDVYSMVLFTYGSCDPWVRTFHFGSSRWCNWPCCGRIKRSSCTHFSSPFWLDDKSRLGQGYMKRSYEASKFHPIRRDVKQRNLNIDILKSKLTQLPKSVYQLKNWPNQRSHCWAQNFWTIAITYLHERSKLESQEHSNEWIPCDPGSLANCTLKLASFPSDGIKIGQITWITLLAIYFCHTPAILAFFVQVFY